MRHRVSTKEGIDSKNLVKNNFFLQILYFSSNFILTLIWAYLLYKYKTTLYVKTKQIKEKQQFLVCVLLGTWTWNKLNFRKVATFCCLFFDWLGLPVFQMTLDRV